MESPHLDLLKVIEEVCCGNTHALTFCHAFLAWIRLIDATTDAGQSPGDFEHVALVCIELMRTVAFNSFWQEHKAALTPLVIQGAKAFLDAKRWRQRPDFRDRATADVLKSQFQEVFWHVAHICGGYNHMDRITQKYRTYDYAAAEG